MLIQANAEMSLRLVVPTLIFLFLGGCASESRPGHLFYVLPKNSASSPSIIGDAEPVERASTSTETVNPRLDALKMSLKNNLAEQVIVDRRIRGVGCHNVKVLAGIPLTEKVVCLPDTTGINGEMIVSPIRGSDYNTDIQIMGALKDRERSIRQEIALIEARQSGATPAIDAARSDEPAPVRATTARQPAEGHSSPFTINRNNISQSTPSLSNGDCQGLGVMDETECVDYEGYAARLKVGLASFVAPKQMTEGDTYATGLSVSLNVKDALAIKNSLLDVSGRATSFSTKVARFMSARLYGAGFKVNPSGPIEQRLTGLQPTTWQWRVTPLQSGKQILQLETFVHLIIDKSRKERVSLPIESREIDVAVKPLPSAGIVNGAVSKASKLTDAGTKFFQSIAGLVAAVVALLTVFGWSRKRTAKSAGKRVSHKRQGA